MSPLRIASGVIVGLILLACLMVAFSVRDVRPTSASCRAVGGVLNADHECMKNGRAVDPNDEAAP